jgi:UDP-GlcNAc:undecaprenyl-phosphate GlcNAc-1-phosphate transferase
MYMGDSGSQFLGVFLSILSIKFLWSFRPSSDSNFALQQFILPAVAFLLPITDTTTVFVRRIARGQSPFQGGRDHTTHHLVYCGLTDKQVARVFLLLSLLSVAAVLFISQHFLHNTWTYTQSVVSIMACLTLFLVMQYFYNLGKKRQQTQAAITEKLANVLQKEHTAASANKRPINFKKSNLSANKKKTPE